MPIDSDAKNQMTEQERDELRDALKNMSADELREIRFVIYAIKHKTMSALELDRMAMAPLN